MPYTNLPGLKVTLQDKNLILPSANEAQTGTVLCIAPIWELDGKNNAPDDENVNPVYDVVTIRKSDDLVYNGFGQFTTTNPMARLWKQAVDTGASIVKVVRLHGKTLEERYIGLHNILTVLTDYDEYDVIVVGGLYADSRMFATIEDPAKLLIAQRLMLMSAINADEILTWTAQTDAAVAKGTVNSVEAYVLTKTFVDLDSIVVAGEGIAFTAHPADAYSNFPYLTGVTGSPDTLSVTYNYVADATTIDSIDLAKTLTRKVSTTILAADIATSGSPLVLEATANGVTTYTLDLSDIEEYTDYDGNTVTIVDSNGELVMSGIGYEISAGVVTFFREPANWTVTFGITSYCDFGAQVASFLEQVNARGKQALGVMAMQPIASATLKNIKDYVNGLPLAQYSKYLQMISGPQLIFQLNTVIYKDTWQGAYAGMVAVLPSYRDPLSKPIPGVIKQEYQLSQMQALALLNKHYVFARRSNQYVVCSDAVTTAEDGSDFARLTTIRIVNESVALVREIADPYIGQPNSPEIRAGLETAIKNGLDGMVKAGAIKGYRFAILATAADQLQGSMNIMLEIEPVFAIREIRLSVAVRPGL